MTYRRAPPRAARRCRRPGKTHQSREVGEQPRVGGRGGEDRPIQRDHGTEVEDPERPSSQRLGIDVREHANHVTGGRHEPQTVKHRGAEQIEGHRGHRVDDERARDVDVHHPNPATRPRHPFSRSIARPDESCVALLDAPVRVHHQLRGTNARDAEDRDGRRKARGRKLKAEACLPVSHGDRSRPENEDGRGAHGEQREQADFDDGEAFNPVVAAPKQQRQRDRRRTPPPRRSPRGPAPADGAPGRRRRTCHRSGAA